MSDNYETLIEQIAKDIVSCVLEHFHFCYPWLKCSSHQSSPQTTLLNQSESIKRLFVSNRLHPAMIDRSAEVEYLKHTFSILCKHDFPEPVKTSTLAKSLIAECFALQVMQLSDMISDPDRMNLVIAKILSGAKKKVAGPGSPSVPFLYRYFYSSSFELGSSSTYESPNKKITSEFIMKDGILFSLFMKFLYRQDAVHYIQCLGDLRELKISRHFASKKSFLKVEDKFFQCSKFDRILLSRECMEEWLTVLRAFEIIPWDRKEKLIVKIEAEIHETLNQCYVDRFRKSYDFVKGRYIDDNGAERLKSYADRDSKHASSESSETPASSRLSSMNLTDESSMSMSVSHSERTESCPSPVNENSECVSPNKFEVDMSSFRIEIEPDLYDVTVDGKEANVVSVTSSIGGSNMWYKIEVRRISPNLTAESSHRSVFRKFEHFVVLHTKLRYHYAKELRDIKPPSKPAIILGNSCEYYRKMVPSLENYLKYLLARPRLRHSGTFYNFLTKTSSEDFEEKTILEKLVHTKNGITGNITNIANKESGKALEIEFLPKFALTAGQGKARLKVNSLGPMETGDSYPRKQSTSKHHSVSVNGMSSLNGNLANTAKTSHINPSLQNNAFLDIMHLMGSLNIIRRNSRKTSSTSAALNEKQMTTNSLISTTGMMKKQAMLQKSASCDPSFHTNLVPPPSTNSSSLYPSSNQPPCYVSRSHAPVFAFCYDCCISSKLEKPPQPSSMFHPVNPIISSNNSTHAQYPRSYSPPMATEGGLSNSNVSRRGVSAFSFPSPHKTNVSSNLTRPPPVALQEHVSQGQGECQSNQETEFSPSDANTVDFSLNFQSYFDYLIYFCVYIYNTSIMLQKLVCGPLKIITAKFVDRFCSRFVRRKIVEGLDEDQIEYFLNFLHSNLDPANSVPGTAVKTRSFQDKNRRRNRTLTLMRNFFNYRLISIFIGQQKHNDTTEILFKILQYSKLNKHLFYQILDKIVARLYE